MKGLYFSRLRITHGIVMLSETAKPMKSAWANTVRKHRCWAKNKRNKTNAMINYYVYSVLGNIEYES